MLIFWRGFGWAVPAVVIAFFLLAEISLNALFGEGFYQKSDWSKGVAIFFSALSIAGLGYFLNYKKRITYQDSQTGKIQKSSSHTFFFIPIEYWSIILVAGSLFIWMNGIEQDKSDIAFIENPVINDQYSADFSIIFNGGDSKFKYGVLKVASIFPEGVELKVSNVTYDKKKGVNKDIQSGKADEAAYYSEKTISFTKDDLLKLKANKGIFSIVRK